MYYDAKVVKCCEIAKYKQHFYLPTVTPSQLSALHVTRITAHRAHRRLMQMNKCIALRLHWRCWHRNVSPDEHACTCYWCRNQVKRVWHDFWLKAVLTRVSETDSCVAVLSRTSAILPNIRLARLAYSANGKQGFADTLRRAVGGSWQTKKGENSPFHPLLGW